MSQRSESFHHSDPNCYEKSGTGCFTVYGIEYNPGFDDGVCTPPPLERIKTDNQISTSYGSTTTSARGPLVLQDSPLMMWFKLAPDLSLRSRWFVDLPSPPVDAHSLLPSSTSSLTWECRATLVSLTSSTYLSR